MLTDDELGMLMALREDRYRHLVITLFRSGRATQAQWIALADALLYAAQHDPVTEPIDRWIVAHSA